MFEFLSRWIRKPHQHALQTLWGDDHAEIDETDMVRHTAFILLACEECRHVEAFPKENFVLCTPRYKEALRRKLANLGWRLKLVE